jgi:hypothetical protein
MAPPLHPSLDPVVFLVGTWEGRGEGSYPTIEDFSYGERLTFGHAGKPFLTYVQHTWDPATGTPMHVETGYLRVVPTSPEPPPGAEGATEEGSEVVAATRVEMVVSQPTGIVEVHLGTVADGVVAMASSLVAVTPTAKEVTAVARQLRLAGEALETRLAMAAVGQPLTHHLASHLDRSSD